MIEWLSRGTRIAIGMVRIIRNGDALGIACEISIELALTHMTRADQTGFLAADKRLGDSVYAGTTVAAGMLCVCAQRVGEDTSLGRLIRLVQDAEESRAPILRIADRFAKYFTPAVILFGLVVYAMTGDIYRAITVLIVGCPCAFSHNGSDLCCSRFCGEATL